ncbi:AAC(3) family N-acetyltransferase [Campylobacter lari]|uniref:AAC(3) family N-acetyltransferase n=1 Tax=Campylobacter TaxID=194 RepID=UPI000B4066D5|nr:AAC(3) family N-acetyltransferase [Campylobacter lari]MBT0831072.1 AAC(3) family N-acetyltransferase [Campylobacter lari]MCR6528480.1 AAC(3) family N-acetyltransferase [Campylobacter lari]MCR6557914.1 AAC(3) family N-acetyltransferase [Campylobacter lari]
MPDLKIVKSSQGFITQKDLVETLKNIGINKGDVVCVHSQLLKIGLPLVPKNKYLHTILECFFEIIGEKGTLIMPTFTYSFCNNEIYNNLESKSKVGLLTEYFRTKWHGVKRTNDPIFSFAIKGAKEKLFLHNTTSCFGDNSVYDVLAKENGKIILFGMDNNGLTFSHFIEEKAKVSYRYYKNFSGIIIDHNKKMYESNINYYVRKPNVISYFRVNQIEILKNNNNFKKELFGDSCIVSIDSKKYLYDTLIKLKHDERILLKNND